MNRNQEIPERICKGEDCETVLIDFVKNPDNGYCYWCADCLSKQLSAGYEFVCHGCGEFYKLESDVAKHWYEVHAEENKSKIENDTQLEITRGHLKNFKDSLEILKARDKSTPPTSENERILFKAERDSVASMIETLQDEIDDYEKRKSS